MGLPSSPSACIFSLTCTKPRSTLTLASSRPRPSEKGARPVHTITASGSMVSTCSFVTASIILTRHGLTPGTPGVTW
eukprot:scaffold23113_cov36-Phaeocystis_antarctica.AAC.1